MELPERKQNRILDYDYSQNGAYFITICTKDRKPLLSDIEGDEAFIILKPYGEIAERWIRMISEKYPQVTVDKYVIMPDHIHMVFRIDSVGEAFRLPCDSDAMQRSGTGNPSPTVGNIMGWYKYQVSKQINQLRNTIGEKVFQRSYYDHVIRNQRDYEEIWEYIEKNPKRWLLKRRRWE